MRSGLVFTNVLFQAKVLGNLNVLSSCGKMLNLELQLQSHAYTRELGRGMEGVVLLRGG